MVREKTMWRLNFKSQNQSSNQMLVLNADGQDTSSFAAKTRAQVMTFSRKTIGSIRKY